MAEIHDALKLADRVLDNPSLDPDADLSMLARQLKRTYMAYKNLMTDEILAGAKFYARAMAQRAVNGIIPKWDDAADDKNWSRTRPDIHDGCLDMVRGIVAACEYKRREFAAGEHAVAILDRPTTDKTRCRA